MVKQILLLGKQLIIGQIHINMKQLIITLLIGISITVSAQNTSIPADRWLELDLYWFEKDSIQQSAEKFIDRYHPLFDNVEGWKGVILNTGWLLDAVVAWNGDLNQELIFPAGMQRPPFYTDKGTLTGNTEERKKQSLLRFDRSSEIVVVEYEKWTYGDVKDLCNALRNIADKKYNIKRLKVGTFVIGWDDAYSGDKSEFSKRQPQLYVEGAFDEGVGVIELRENMKDDATKYGAYPNGVKTGLPFTEFFANQWGSLSKAVGYDAIVLRDAMIGVANYQRFGPYGYTASDDPKKNNSVTRATADLIKFSKQANPDALIIGYSYAGSAVGEWRVNCVDIESIAKEGYMDVYIDQSWSGAWNEAGERHYESNFWSYPKLGWTYHLNYILLHAAMLAETKVKHYFLTDIMDAWESWDIIHTAPDRVKWGIWAYSHAAVKTPTGLKTPAGGYISWCNQSKRLMTEEDVTFLAKEYNMAALDAKNMKEVYGPTLVYNREGMQWMMNNAPEKNIKEWIDEQSGSVMKWSVPIMSVTRMEYVPKVNSDLFIFQTPVHADKENTKMVVDIINSGKPVAIWGSIAGGIDHKILNAIGVNLDAGWITDTTFIADIGGKTDGIYEDIPNIFPVYHLSNANFSINDDIDVIYRVLWSPALMHNHTNNKNVLLWDVPEHSNILKMIWGISTDKVMGSVYPWLLGARTLQQMLKENNSPYATNMNSLKPISTLFWQTKDGNYKLLAGEVEEGICHTADRTTSIEWNIPKDWIKDKVSFFSPDGTQRGYFNTTGNYIITLDQGEVNIYNIDIK